MMDCLKEFQFYVQKTTTFSTADSNYVTWLSGTNSSWLVKGATDALIFNVQGFKNIDLYGIKILADIQSGVGGTSQAIVDDYKFRIYPTGTVPSISGTFSTNSYNAKLIPVFFSLSKYQNEIMFKDPILSLTTIEMSVFSAQGINPRSTSQITLDLNFNIYFYYKFQGEGEDLLY